jgi:TldD protein
MTRTKCNPFMTCLQLSCSLLAAWLPGSLSLACADQVPEDDIVFKALGEELKRSMSLRLEDLDKPYFIQYAVDDSVTHRISASYGALVRSTRDHSRVLHSQVRVGAYELDNSNFAGGRGGGGGRGLAISIELPVDDGYMALRQAIWRATDFQYKDAVETLTQKRAYMKDRTVADRSPDFIKAAAVTIIKDRASLSFDRAAWEDYVRRISARFGEYRHIQNADASLVTGSENRYLVNSEGSRMRHGETEVLLRITADALTDDGDRLSDFLTYNAATLEQLPAITEVLADVSKLADRLAAAVRAPILEDYTGPVLIDGIAAPQFFRQLLARGISGQAEPVGARGRGNQGSDDLENRLGKRILPPTFQIYDDPRQDKFQGTFLTGHYEFDDEGLPAQRVNIVVDGKLDGMVMSRTPTKQFAQSNGHGRRAAGETPRSSVGCLYIESTKSESPADLKKELLDAADSEGLKFGLRITSLQNRAGGGAAGFGGRGGRGGGGGVARLVGEPISIYKVYVADGREEPVRGCEFNAVDVRSLRKIIAAGNVLAVHNSTGGAVPSSSVIAPAVLIEELELTRIKREAERKPIIDPPHARKMPADGRD